MALAPGNLNSYNLSDMLTGGMDMKRRIALQLMQSGMDTSPVQHWSQGAAKALQAAMGGYELYSADQEDKAKNEADRKALFGPAPETPQAPPAAPTMLPPAPQQQPQQPSPVVGALSGQGGVPMPPPRPQAPLSEVPLDQQRPPQSAVAAALTSPQAKPAIMGPSAPPSPVPAPTSVAPQATIDPTTQYIKETEARIAQLGTGGPAAIAQAQKLRADLDTFKKTVVRTVQPGERGKFGLSPDDKNPYQVGADGKLHPVNPQPYAVNINNTAESAFSTEAAKHQAKRFDELAGEGMKAKQMVSDIGTLQTLGTMIGTGKIAEFKSAIGPYADAIGVKVQGLPEIQAYEAVVNRVAPNLRVPGSGAQSDYELRNFLKSLPTLGNTPGGNEIAARVMEGFYQNKVAASEIGSDALSGKITRHEAEKKIRELPDPMKEWRDWKKQEGTSENKGSALKTKYGLE